MHSSSDRSRPGICVRAEREGDEDSIRAVNLAAFDGPVEARIVDDLRGTDRWIPGGSLVAVESEGGVVGHLLLSEGDLVAEDGAHVLRIWMVGPVAVRPDRQRSGIGAALMQSAITLATANEQPILCLLGHASYYPRFGFEPARELGILPPRPWPDANWMVLRLPAWRPEVRGTARFAPAFPD